jgi:cellulose synthase operon protein YhjQ
MLILALVSTGGGAGRSTLTATLADVWRRRGRAVLALDLDPHNGLALQLGAAHRPSAGLASAVLAGKAWHETAQSNSDGVSFVPNGETSPAEQLRFAELLGTQPRWLAQELSRIALPPEAIVLVDTPRLPSVQAAHAIGVADLVLGVLAPDAASYAQLDRLESLRPQQTRYVLNGFEPQRPLQHDLRLLLRDELGDRLAPLALHHDASIVDAQARNRALLDDAPHSQAAEDVQLLASWLAQTLPRGRGS